MMPALAGLALGLASSAHCAAMCGPLVLAIGQRFGARSRRAQLGHALLHHAGRIAIYTALAVPAALAGHALVLQGLGRVLAIGAGTLLLASAIGASGVRVPGGGRLSVAIARASGPVFRWAARHSIAGPLATGALNGLLPCGLVYAALTTAAATGRTADAMLLMAGFGSGTAAILIAMSMSAASIPASLRVRLRPVGPIVLALTALILIVRGTTAWHHHAPSARAAAAHVHR